MAALPHDRANGGLPMDFLGLLGHEYRNLLGPALNAVHFLKGRALPDADARSALALVERQLDGMVGIVEMVADLSRLARGTVALSSAPFDVDTLVAAAVAEGRPALLRKGQQCETTLTGQAVAHGDAARLANAIETLVRCASKALRTNASIAVATRATRDTWEVVVGSSTDDVVAPLDGQEGPSVAPPRTGAAPDSVGLTLVAAVARLHGGTLVVTPFAGEGIQYRLCVPRRAGQPAVAQPRAADVTALPSAHPRARIPSR